MEQKRAVEKLIESVGSFLSLILHTFGFAVFFGLAILGFISWNGMLLVLTTIVSLEAIYLAIFIQMTVNRQAKELAEVSEDVEEIQEDIDEIQKDVEEISDDEAEEEKYDKQQAIILERLTSDVQQLLASLEELKKK